jgi:mono/diheme cytochrome c family protein
MTHHLRRALVLGTAAAAVIGWVAVRLSAQVPLAPTGRPATFERVVQPILLDTCAECHNDREPTAGLSISHLAQPSSLRSERDAWERILDKLRAREMPPPFGPPIPAEEIDALVAYVQAEFDRVDKGLVPDPGRVPIHRLNRAEYANTIRDLLGVDFRATDEFPADDSGYGFDNIGDVLTVSPTLMQKYLSAAESIAARVVGGGPLPSPGIFTKRSRVRAVGDGAIELREIVNYDADYVVRVAVTGNRLPTDRPVTLVISVDGKPVKTATVPVQLSEVNRQGGATQRAVEEVRVFLPSNEHVFRAEFVNDDDLRKIPEADRRTPSKNIYPEFIDLAGPYAPLEPRSVRNPRVTCDPAAGRACAEQVLTSLVPRAYRRPVRPAEVEALLDVYDKALAGKYSSREALQFSIAAMLVSPHFLFRIERDPRAGVIAPVSDLELASRLSYFLWSSMPDDPLLRLAEKNLLRRPGVLEAQVRRMLGDWRSAALTDNFAGQWLETRSLEAVTPDRTRFPAWSPELRDAMREETRLFFDAVLRHNRPISDFIDGQYTFLNARLARHYGIEGVEGSEFRRVDLATDQRSGVFTQGSVLTVSSYPTRTSVVLRGKYLLENVLNSPPPPPPADVPALDDAEVGLAKSLREQTEAHRAVPLCASCHVKMDPLGFALENYDAIGQWRTEDGKLPLDVSGTLPNGTAFSGPRELKAILKERMPAFARSLSEKMLTYAIGRGVEGHDRLVIRSLVNEMAANDYRIQSLIQGIVRSVPFQQRRGERTPRAQEARHP